MAALARFREGEPEPARRLASAPAAPALAEDRAGGPFGQCQFIAGDPRRGGAACGRPSRPGSSYCAEHHALCHLEAMAGDWP